MGKSGEKTKGAQLFNDFQNLSRIWTHPRVLQMNAEKAERTAEKKVKLMDEKKLQVSVEDFQFA
jgi:transcriptional regulator ATRX